MAAATVAAGFAAGLAMVASALFPSPVPLDRALADLQRPRVRHDDLTARLPPGLLSRVLGSRLADSGWGRRSAISVAANLRVTATSPGEYLACRVGFALLGALWAPLVFAVMRLGGVEAGPVLPLWLSLALAPVGFLFPVVALRSKAAERRQAFRHALSAFLDVVSIGLAGGRGVDSALHDAAGSGRGWAFDELRAALLEAQLLGETPWAGLARLGEDLAVPELGELAASTSMAGAEGARVKASLAAKARSLRLRSLTEIKGAAEAASERMSLPIVLLLVGFIVFVTYPAIDKVLTGL